MPLGIALTPEGRRIFPSLTIEENLLVGAHSKRKGPWDLTKVYEAFPLAYLVKPAQWLLTPGIWLVNLNYKRKVSHRLRKVQETCRRRRSVAPS